MTNPASPASQLRPAATVIVLRDTAAGLEVFMVRRHDRAAFMGGAHVFPGGRVELTDASAADPSWCDGLETADIPSLPRPEDAAHRLAGIRELFEEAGVLLARDERGQFFSTTDRAAHERLAQYRLDLHAGTVTLKAIAELEGLRLSLDALVPFARWITPPVDTRQFDAWFFMARMPPDQTPAADNLETTHGAWLRPADVVTMVSSGDVAVPPPTWTTIRELERFATVDGAMAWARARRIEPRQPAVHEIDGHRFLLLPGDPLDPRPWHEPPPIETRFRVSPGRWMPERAE